MTEAEWNTERERLKPNTQSRGTRHSRSEEINRMARLQSLLGGARDEERAELIAATRGYIEITPERAAELVEILNTPVQWRDVVARQARRV